VTNILSLIKHHFIGGGVEVQLHAFLTLAIDGGECSASRSGHFTPKVISSHYPGGRVGFRACLDAVAKKKIPIFAPSENRTPVVQPVS
jgi:hypothetical protein